MVNGDSHRSGHCSLIRLVSSVPSTCCSLLEVVMLLGLTEKTGSWHEGFVHLPDLLIDRWDWVLEIHPFSSDTLRRIVTYFTNAHTCVQVAPQLRWWWQKGTAEIYSPCRLVCNFTKAKAVNSETGRSGEQAERAPASSAARAPDLHQLRISLVHSVPSATGPHCFLARGTALWNGSQWRESFLCYVP